MIDCKRRAVIVVRALFHALATIDPKGRVPRVRRPGDRHTWVIAVATRDAPCWTPLNN